MELELELEKPSPVEANVVSNNADAESAGYAPANNPIAQRRSDYMDLINDVYAKSYGSWLEKQTTAKQDRIKAKAGWVKHGLTMLAPVSCKGPDRCPWFSACPIPESIDKPGPKSDYPINLPCVLEVEYLSQQTCDYMNQLEVDPSNPIEMSLVQELGLLDLLRNRAVLVLSHGDARGHGRDMLTIDESIVDWSDDGQPLTSQATKIHPAVEIMDKHTKRQARILDQFIATRASKVKLYGGNIESNTELHKHLEAMRNWMITAAKQGFTLSDQGVEFNTDIMQLVDEEESLLERIK